MGTYYLRLGMIRAFTLVKVLVMVAVIVIVANKREQVALVVNHNTLKLQRKITVQSHTENYAAKLCR